jgi:hypothetical protein
MQTFFHGETIFESAETLDSKRLNKQILEGYQILKLLSDYHDKKAWAHHPAVLMWKGHEYSLRSYIATMIGEARKRGIKTDKHWTNLVELESNNSGSWGENMPKWFSGEKSNRIKMTHRANLYRKNPEYYAEYAYAVNDKYNKPCCEKCNYYWPTHEERNVR